jgi:hypothetical protein
MIAATRKAERIFIPINEICLQAVSNDAVTGSTR